MISAAVLMTAAAILARVSQVAHASGWVKDPQNTNTMVSERDGQDKRSCVDDCNRCESISDLSTVSERDNVSASEGKRQGSHAGG